MRSRLGGLLVAVLVAVTGAAVVLALRPQTAPPAASSLRPPMSGTVAVHGSDVWRWVGPQDCVPGADGVPVQRRAAGGWVGADVPLRNVTRLSFANARDGIAIGTTATCGLGVALTHDGGLSWGADPANPPLLDAWYVGRTVWGITRLDGPAQLVGYTVDGMRLVGASTTTDVCDAVDGTPTLTAFTGARRGLLLCEQQLISGRLLARTFDGGSGWERLTDARPLTGLDGPGPVLDLDLAGPDGRLVWVLMADGRCPQGQLRRSLNGGGSFVRLPCPSGLDQVLGAGFSSPDDGVLLALVDSQPVVLATTDGGTSWSRP